MPPPHGLNVELPVAGEPAVHLLERMLAFDPGRRCSGEEALAHEYFADLEAGDEEIGARCRQLRGYVHTGGGFLFYPNGLSGDCTFWEHPTKKHPKTTSRGVFGA